ncbi:hypothetical protein AG4045_006995, partial [Apium graveolens]
MARFPVPVLVVLLAVESSHSPFHVQLGLFGHKGDGGLVVGDMIDPNEEMMMESESVRRNLGGKRYISYGALNIVGCLCGFGQLEVVGTATEKGYKNFTDYSVTSTITLWGNLGELLDLTSYTQDGGPYVIVVSSVTVKTYQDINFGPIGSKIYVNLDV